MAPSNEPTESERDALWGGAENRFVVAWPFEFVATLRGLIKRRKSEAMVAQGGDKLREDTKLAK